VGFILAVISIGRLLDSNYLNLLPIITVILFVAIWLITLITPQAHLENHESEEIGLWQIIKKPEVIAFFCVHLLLQAAHSPYYVFYSVYLKQFSYSGNFIGGLWALGVVAEVILFMFMHKLLTLFSLRQLLLTSAFLSMLRWLIIALAADSLYWIISAQLLHAATFGLAHAVAIHLIHQYFGHRHQGKGQALYISTSFGIGGMLGSFLSGYYWDSFGAMIIYNAAAACCLFAFIISYIAVGRKH
jgi:PPP family 3-phenylpropionic acid transporter